jgi:predicted flap endonuclease-1-like 5' DNA nuclease
VKKVEKLIWFGLIPATAAVWVARRLTQRPGGPGLMPAAEETKAPAAPATADDLKVISGIGPVYERRLHAAGIRTYQQLLAATPERLLAIVQATPGLADPDAWIEQARRLARDS